MGQQDPSNPIFQYSSTQEEILQAVRENSVQRGRFFLKNLLALNIDELVQDIENLGAYYDIELWRELAMEEGIDSAALDKLSDSTPSVPYPLYFCLSSDLIEKPRRLLYYRNVAMISNKVMSNIGTRYHST